MVLLSFQGRANYTNLSRYSELPEKTYRRWYEKKKLDFIKFNQIGNSEIIPATATKVTALDCSFVSKSGKKTYGLTRCSTFYIVISNLKSIGYKFFVKFKNSFIIFDKPIKTKHRILCCH
jgi:hypothetical protein